MPKSGPLSIPRRRETWKMKSYVGVVRTTAAEVHISFPDVPGPEGTGATIEVARGNASRALASHLRGQIEQEVRCPRRHH